MGDGSTRLYVSQLPTTSPTSSLTTLFLNGHIPTTLVFLIFLEHQFISTSGLFPSA